MRECRIALRSCHVSTKRAVTELATRVMIMIPEKTIVKSEKLFLERCFSLLQKVTFPWALVLGRESIAAFLVSLRLHKTDRLYALTSICIYTHIYVYFTYTVYVYV